MRAKLPLLVALMLILALSGGCKQRCFLTEQDFNRTQTTVLNGMEASPDLSYKPLHEAGDAPPTLNHLERKIRFLSLAEAISISLEQGTVGQGSLLFPGQGIDNLTQFAGGAFGGGTTGSDAIRVLSLTPAAQGATIELALAKFDAVFSSSIQWQTTDQPIGTPLQSFQAGNQSFISQTDATVQTGIFKPLATGGTAGVTFTVPYQFTNLPARVNPSYRPSLQFQFEQPLLQGFGVEINQLNATHPNSLLLNFVGQNQQVRTTGQINAEGIVIQRIRFDQSRADLERSVNQMLLNVETAYWNLYGSYWTLYSREQGLRFAFEAFKLNKARYEAGRATAADFYQSRGQYELFRAQRLAAIQTTLENERQLRMLLGMRIDDGTRLMPSDSPTLSPYQPDWKVAWEEAMARRPELYIQRQEVKARQLILQRAKNGLLPDLRFATSYDFNSIGNRLDGPNNVGGTETNAFRGLADGNFSSWQGQLRLVVPIGFRAAHTDVRIAQLLLASAMEQLNDQELKVERFLGRQYELLSTTYEQIRANRAQREAFGEQLRARQQEFLAGRGTLDTLLEAQRFWADALANEFQQIVAYNNALAGWEYGKGTILQHDNVTITEGPLPACAAVKAVEHERQRTASIVLFERANPVAPKCFEHPEPMMPGKAPSLPAAMEAVPPLKEAPMLPSHHAQANEMKPPVEAKIEEVFGDSPPKLNRVPPMPVLPTAPVAKPPVPTTPTTLPPPPTTPTTLPPPTTPTALKQPVRRPTSEFGSERQGGPQLP